MADAAEAEKVEKLAAAKRRFEELKKEKQKAQKAESDKAKKGDGTKDKAKKGETTKKKKAATKPKDQDPADSKSAEKGEEKAGDENDDQAADKDEKEENDKDTAAGPGSLADNDEDGLQAPAADQTATSTAEPVLETTQSNVPARHARQPSLSIQSRMRSDSFRKGNVVSPRSPSSGSKGQSLPALSADGESVNEIYRKQTLRLEELERENKLLTKDSEAALARQRKMEDELEELRESASQVVELKARADKATAKDEEITKLKIENASLQRQNTHLQTSRERSSRKDTTSPAANNSTSSSPPDLQAQIYSQTSTIESMELEISNLRAELAKASTGHTEQIQALEDKASRAERAAGSAQRELLDARKSLERASEKAVRDGTQRTSAETQILTLQRELGASQAAHEEAAKKAEQLTSKLSALTTLHKDTDARRQATVKELAEARRQLDQSTTETARLRAEKARDAKRDGTGATDDDGLDELEDEARAALAARVRDLEAEIFELRRGVWRDRRRELQSGDDEAVLSPRGSVGFDEVDLIGGARRPSASGSGAGRRTSSFKTVLTSGIKAFTGDSAYPGGANPYATAAAGAADAGDREGLLEEDDDDLEFDEDAFRLAQQEDAKRRLERVRETKRGLVAFRGFRIDLVEARRVGGVGLGEIFDV